MSSDLPLPVLRDDLLLHSIKIFYLDYKRNSHNFELSFWIFLTRSCQATRTILFHVFVSGRAKFRK